METAEDLIGTCLALALIAGFGVAGWGVQALRARAEPLLLRYEGTLATAGRSVTAGIYTVVVVILLSGVLRPDLASFAAGGAAALVALFSGLLWAFTVTLSQPGVRKRRDPMPPVVQGPLGPSEYDTADLAVVNAAAAGIAGVSAVLSFAGTAATGGYDLNAGLALLIGMLLFIAVAPWASRAVFLRSQRSPPPKRGTGVGIGRTRPNGAAPPWLLMIAG